MEPRYGKSNHLRCCLDVRPLQAGNKGWLSNSAIISFSIQTAIFLLSQKMEISLGGVGMSPGNSWGFQGQKWLLVERRWEWIAAPEDEVG